MSSLIKPNSTLSDEEKRYCECLILTQTPGNPFINCYKQIGTTSGRCDTEYNYPAFKKPQLLRVAEQRYISIPEPYDREQMLQNIEQHLKEI